MDSKHKHPVRDFLVLHMYQVSDRVSVIRVEDENDREK